MQTGYQALVGQRLAWLHRTACEAFKLRSTYSDVLTIGYH